MDGCILADIGNPGILALNLETKDVRRFANETVQAEKVDMIIDGKLINFGGAPASVAINPITLSADKGNLVLWCYEWNYLVQSTK